MKGFTEKSTRSRFSTQHATMETSLLIISLIAYQWRPENRIRRKKMWHTEIKKQQHR